MKFGSCFLLAMSVVCGATDGSAQILSPDRTTVWKPGVPGGVPARTAVCARLDAATYANGALDASAAIQQALNACPAGQVVALSAGIFTTNTHRDSYSSLAVRRRGRTTGTNNGAARALAEQTIIKTYTHDARTS